MSLFSRFVNAIRSDARDDELDEELRFHVEEQTRRLIAEGVSPDEAARAARLRLGNAVILRERSRDIRLLPWLDAVLRDARFGVRMLRKDVHCPAVTQSLRDLSRCRDLLRGRFRAACGPRSAAQAARASP